MAALTGVEGTLEGRQIEIEDDEVTLGRENVDVVLEDREVSRRHASIRRTERGLELTDLGSTNGTFVNDRRIEEPTIVKDGDVIRLGGNRFRVEEDWKAAETIATPAVASSSGTGVRDPVPDYVPATEDPEGGLRATEPLPVRGRGATDGEPRDRRPWILAGIAALAILVGVVGYMLLSGGEDDDSLEQAAQICSSITERANGIRLAAPAGRLRRDVRALQRARAHALTRLRRLEVPEENAKRFDALLARMKETNGALARFGRALSRDRRKTIKRARSGLRRAAQRERAGAQAADLPACGRLVVRR